LDLIAVAFLYEVCLASFQIVREEVISDEVMPDINTTYFAYKEYTFKGCILLSYLACGAHRFSIDAQKSTGNTAVYETITFTIPNEPEPFPTLLVATASVIIAVVFAVFLFVRKHKQ